jgi:hypothetical protein
MTEVGVFLAVVGLCDLVRATRDVTSTARRLTMAVLGILLLAFFAVALKLPAERTSALLAGWVGCFLLWLLGSASALSRGPTVQPGRAAGARALAFLGLAAGIVLGVLGADLAGPVGAALPGPLGELDTERVALVVGVSLAQLATANVVVRLVLDAVGVPAAANEKQLKGGRLLGPMERVFIVGLGLAGELTAASVVVAAKGLLRFPELQRGAHLGGPSDISEYFLIGTFASWLLALGGLGLVALG